MSQTKISGLSIQFHLLCAGVNWLLPAGLTAPTNMVLDQCEQYRLQSSLLQSLLLCWVTVEETSLNLTGCW